jgi:transposase
MSIFTHMKLRVTYAKRSYKDRVYITPLIQYSYRDEHGTPRHKTVLSLAKLPAHVVKVIDDALQHGDTRVLETQTPVANFRYERAVSLGPAWVSHQVMAQLGIVAALRTHLTPAQAVAALGFIQERVTAERPLSVSALQRHFDEAPSRYLLGSPSSPALNTWYAALTSLEHHRPAILKALYQQSPPPLRVFLYDITSSYFEGTCCPLAAFGYNRDGKKGKKQVVIGVIADGEGRPVWCDVFQGNTSDQTTVRDQLLVLRDQFQVQEFIFVGDRGMVTSARIEELDQEGWWESFSYITALKRRELLRVAQDDQHPLQPELVDHHHLVEVEHEGVRYVVCYNPHRHHEDTATRERLLALTEGKLDGIAISVKQGRLKRKDAIARRVHRWINRWGMERFFEVTYDEGFISSTRKTAEIDRYAKLDGCYVIRSNVHLTRLSPEQLQQQYKDLKYVEQVFRTMKTTDIDVRPIRVWTEHHVRGYIFGCFLAYRVIWEIRHRLAPVLERHEKNHSNDVGNLQEVWRYLGTISAGIFYLNGVRQVNLSTLSARHKHLFTLLSIPAITSGTIQGYI